MTTTDLLPGTPETAIDYQARADKLQRRLELIYGPERVVEWLEEGTALPEVRVDPFGTVKFRGQVLRVAILRQKEGGPRVVVQLMGALRNCPINDLASLSDSAPMDIRISPRAVQPGLPMGFGVIAQQDGDDETDISDEVLEQRLSALSARTGSLPDDWRDWSQERKNEVGLWAWAMILAASDPDVVVPPAPEDILVWYGGETWRPQSTNGTADGDWQGSAPPVLTDEQAAEIRERAAAVNGSAGLEAKPAAAADKPKRTRKSTRGKKS